MSDIGETYAKYGWLYVLLKWKTPSKLHIHALYMNKPLEQTDYNCSDQA